MRHRLRPQFAALLLAAFATKVVATCSDPVLLHEKRDASTILSLESAWTSAFLGGDAAFMACLLTPDFTEIMRNGDIYRLSDELALAEKNNSKNNEPAAMPHISVLLHGDVAVAYGLASEKRVEGALHKNYYADYYVWTGGSWRAFFAQWTPVVVPGG
jgi:hypothetical protein